MLKAAFLTCYFLIVPTATLAPAVFVPEPPVAPDAAVSQATYRAGEPGAQAWPAPVALPSVSARSAG